METAGGGAYPRCGDGGADTSKFCLLAFRPASLGSPCCWLSVLPASLPDRGANIALPLTSFWTEGVGSQSSDAAVSGLGFLSSCQPMMAMGGGFCCANMRDAARCRSITFCGPRSRMSSCRYVCGLTLTAPPGVWTLDWEQMTARH